MAVYRDSTVVDELIQKIQSKSLTNGELKAVKQTLMEDFPSYWKWRSKYNMFGIASIVLAIVEIVLFLILLGVIPVIEIAAGSPQAQQAVMGLVVVLILFFVSNILTAFFALKVGRYTHVGHLLKLMKRHYPKELVTFNIQSSLDEKESKVNV